jgi:hypothetical protein
MNWEFERKKHAEIFLRSIRVLPYFKKGKKVYFKRTELEEWLNSGKKSVGDEDKAPSRDLFIRSRTK